MITTSTRVPTTAERLARYYDALPASPGFHPHYHAARAARGLRIIARSTSAPCLAHHQGSFLATGGRQSPSNLSRAGCAHPALFLLEHFLDETDPRDPSAAL